MKRYLIFLIFSFVTSCLISCSKDGRYRKDDGHYGLHTAVTGSELYIYGGQKGNVFLGKLDASCMIRNQYGMSMVLMEANITPKVFGIPMELTAGNMGVILLLTNMLHILLCWEIARANFAGILPQANIWLIALIVRWQILFVNTMMKFVKMSVGGMKKYSDK